MPSNLAKNLATARRAAAAGTAVSGLLSTLKIVAGMLAQSHAMIADGVESAGDSVAGLVVLFGLAQAAVPPDDEHPYGHTRAEDIAGKTVSTLMLVSGVILLQTNGWGLWLLWQGERQPEMPPIWTVWLMLLAMLAKGVLFVYKLRVGRRLRSVALSADAWNDFTDMISAAAVIGGLLLARRGYLWADRGAAACVSLLIIYTAHAVSKAADAALLDQQAPPDVLNQLRASAMTVQGVHGVEKLLARRSGLMYFVDLHLEVDGDMPVNTAHAIGHEVKARLQDCRDDVADVLIHLEPAGKAVGVKG